VLKSLQLFESIFYSLFFSPFILDEKHHYVFSFSLYSLKDIKYSIKEMLIGLCGYIGSGKDTCASILERTYHFKRIAFATPIKDIVSHLFGWNRLALEGSTKEDRIWREQVDPWWSKQLNLRITPRRMLQMIGGRCFVTV